MKISRKVNGYKVIVKDWDSTVYVYDIKTNEVIGKQKFSDHIKAVIAAKAL